MTKMTKELKTELEENGYFFHRGGDFHGELLNPKKRGIWKQYENGKKIRIGQSWWDASVHNEHNSL